MPGFKGEIVSLLRESKIHPQLQMSCVSFQGEMGPPGLPGAAVSFR